MRKFIKFIFEQIMNVYTQSKIAKVDLMPSGTAYAAGDVIGTAGGSGVDGGKIPLPNAVRFPTQTALLQSLTLFDGSNQKPALKVLLFAGKPDGQFTDNAPPQGLNSGADGTDKLLAVISVDSADWTSISASGGTTAVATKSNLGVVVCVDSAAGVDNLYAVFISGGTPDYIGGADELVAQFGFIQD